MSKLILILFCIASFVFAGSDVPELRDSSGLPQVSNKPEKPQNPDKENLPELSDSAGRHEEQWEEVVSIYSIVPEQETPELPGMRLSTSDMPDSNDMICTLEPPHLLLVRSKD